MGSGRRSGERPEEQQAVRTTIVGGRPPGSGKPLGEIPRGIEVLVKKAAVDAAFRELLLAGRAAAAEAIGLVLEPAEAALLDVVPAEQLRAVIDRTRVAPDILPAFLGKAAAVMLVALGASSVTAQVRPAKGVRPARPPATAPAPARQPGVAGVRPAISVRVAGIRGPESPPATQPASQPTTRPAGQPATRPVSAEEFRKLIRQLDADDYKQRDAAQTKLQALMPGIIPQLEQALKAKDLSPEQQMRIEGILATAKPPVRPVEIRVVTGIRLRAVAGVRLQPVAGERADAPRKNEEKK